MTTLLYASILVLFYVALSVHVIRGRRLHKIALGQADHNQDMTARIRAQGNFSEYTPIFLILLYLLESNGLHIYLLHALGVLFIMGRVSHAYSLLKHEKYEDGKLLVNPKFRILGMMLTFNTLMLCALCGLYIALIA
jgi:uncharacterized protein